MAIISLPQIINQIIPMISSIVTAIMMRLMIFFLDTGFLAFFCLGLELSVVSVGESEILSSPLCSSKSNTWVGLRKSSATEVLCSTRETSWSCG